MSKIGKFINTESQLVVDRAGRGGNEEELLTDSRFLLGVIKIFWS